MSTQPERALGFLREDVITAMMTGASEPQVRQVVEEAMRHLRSSESRVVNVSEADLLARISETTQHYPDFSEIHDDEALRGRELDEVAARHEWGAATDAWLDYAAARFLLDA